ncbi:trimethylamine methyltransferase [Deltaproteobacteria bacterium Smac51]|nr:trimethylamine methyltransferase [Deltaproteobacteria bacterium Smac51]
MAGRPLRRPPARATAERFSSMTNQDVLKIHQTTMRILEKKGMVFHLPAAVELAQKHGLRTDGQTVYFTEKQLMELIGQAPSSFSFRGTNPDRGVVVGRDGTHHIPGGGPQFFLEEGGLLRDAEMKDYVRLSRLFHAADEIAVMAGMVVQPSNVPVDDTLGHVMFQLLRTTDKPLQVMAGDERVTRILTDMVAIASGGPAELEKGPRMMVVANPLSPLKMDHVATYFLMEFARRNQAVIVAPCAMAGSTAPMTMAGAFVQTNAETLAGIALAQMVRPGAPVVYGFLTTAADMKNGSIACGAPEQALSAIWGGKLARFYDLPCRLGGGGLTDAYVAGIQSGYEAMMNLLTASQSGSSISFQSAGVLGSYNAMNMEKAVSDLEIIGMVKRLERGVTVDENTLAETIIEQVAPDGQYLTHPHTVKNCRKELFLPHLSYRGPMVRDDQWQAERRRVLDEVRRREEAYQAPDIPPSVVKELRDYLAKENITPSDY